MSKHTQQTLANTPAKPLADTVGSDRVVSSGGEAHIIINDRTDFYAGPLPHPSLLKQYDDVVPGAAGRIVVLLEEQSRHRMYLEKTVIVGDNKRANWGLISGWSIAILFLITSAALILAGYGAYGAILGTVDLVALVTVFIYGTNIRKNERIEKSKAPRGNKP